ncbi:unnamed protein product [Ilex paraguariensis]|uniref:RNase H type-1 domain-containing protein n=1 Tax=Ilex paraguariensis TaxID=185542 RepID=A0ABC8RE64_9AQUA
MEDWLMNQLQDKCNDSLLLLVFLEGGNEWIYSHCKPNSKSVIIRAVMGIEEMHNSSGKQVHESILKCAEPNWMPPPNKWVKINCDEAYQAKAKEGAYGIVVRNHEGSRITGEAQTVGALSAIVTEAYAVRRALRKASRIALEHGYQAVVIESDAKYLMDSLSKGPEAPIREIASIQKDIWQYLQQIPLVQLQFARRSQNMHPLATQARRGISIPQELVNPLDFLMNVLRKEKRNGIG